MNNSRVRDIVSYDSDADANTAAVNEYSQFTA